jgi:hypothetical protein
MCVCVCVSRSGMSLGALDEGSEASDQEDGVVPLVFELAAPVCVCMCVYILMCVCVCVCVCV